MASACLKNISFSETLLVPCSKDVPEPQVAASWTVSTDQGKYPSGILVLLHTAPQTSVVVHH